MLAINEENVIAIKPANIEFLGSAYRTNVPAKAKTTEAPQEETVIAEEVAAPATDINNPTNADILANEFALPPSSAQTPEAAAETFAEPDLGVTQDTHDSQEEIQEIGTNGNVILDIINDITRIQRELDGIGEKVVLLSSGTIDKTPEKNDAPMGEKVDSLPADSDVPKTDEILPFTPAGENIFDTPAAQGPGLAA